MDDQQTPNQPPISPQGTPNDQQPPPNKYEGPVALTNSQNIDYSASYNSNNQVVHKSHSRQYKILFLVVLLLIIGAVLAYFFLGSDSSSQNKTSDSTSAPVVVNDDTTEETTEVVEEEVVEEPTSEDVAVAPTTTPLERDVERKSDINSVYQKLEEYFNENAYYPADLKSVTLAIGSDVITDPDGNEVTISAPRLSSTMPTDPYTQGQTPSGSQYTYFTYQCNSSVTADAKCNKYVIYSWLETEPTYTKSSLN